MKPMPQSVCHALLAFAFFGLVQGCGASVYQPSQSAQFDADPSSEINDEDVRKAFEAKPQMGPSINVAYYSFAPEKADELEAMIRQQPGVAGVYRLPSLMVTGQRRFDAARPSWMASSSSPFSVKKARVLAARAHCDVVMIFDYSNRVERSANGWTALNVLVLPVLFAPFLDVKVDSYLDSYVIDTRNGYFYAQLSSQQSGEHDTVSIYSTIEEKMKAEQWSKLLQDSTQALHKVLISEQKHAAPVTAAPSGSVTPPAASSSSK